MDYLELEMEKKVSAISSFLLPLVVMGVCVQERIVVENASWLVVVPYW